MHKSEWERWSDFVARERIRNMTLASYYGAVDNPMLSSDQEMATAERVANSIFQDIVALGVLQLPDGVSGDQYQLLTCRRAMGIHLPREVEMLVMSRLGADDEEVLHSPRDVFWGESTMHSDVMRYVIERMSAAARNLAR